MNYCSPHAFTWERYIGVIGYATHDVWDFEHNCPKPHFVEIGRVEGSSLPMRPRPNSIAIMLEDVNCERFWFHLYKEEF